MAINSLSASSNGFSGLVSGMDTQSMVESMLSGTKNKITVQQQKKTTLAYKQEMYRSVSSQLLALKQSYFSYTSKDTNLYSDAFFDTMNAKSASTAFKVTAGSGSAVGNTKVDYIKQLAEAMSKNGKKDVSGKLEGKLDLNALKDIKKSLKGEVIFEVDGVQHKVKLESLAGMSNTEALKQLNEKLLKDPSAVPPLDTGVTAKFENGKFTFSTEGGKPLTIKTGVAKDDSQLAALGLGGEVSNKDGKITTTLVTSKLLPSFDVTLDGVKKTITYDADWKAIDELDKMKPTDAGYEAKKQAIFDGITGSINRSLSKTFGDGVKATINGDKIGFESSLKGSKVILTGGADKMKALGILSNASTKISVGLPLSSISFSQKLQGEEFNFKINGVDFNCSADRSMTSLMQEINSSDAGVNVSYNSFEDRFIMKSTIMGTGTDIQMEDTKGNLLSSMFGSISANTPGAVSGSKLEAGIAYGADYDGKYAGDSTFKLKIDGKEVEIKIPPKDTSDTNVTYTFEELGAAISKAIGENEDAKKAEVALTYDPATKKVTMKAKKDAKVEITDNTGISNLGFKVGQGTAPITKDSTVAQSGMGKGDDQTDQLTIIIEAGGERKTGKFGADVKLSEIETWMTDNLQLNGGTGTAKFNESTGRFEISGETRPTTIKAERDNEALFGSSEIKIFEPLTPGVGNEPETKTGKNSIMSVNGVEIERSSNNFTVEGLAFELSSTTIKIGDDGQPMYDTNGKPIYEKPTLIDVTRDVDKIVDGIKKFVEDYNKIVVKMNELTMADPTYKEYPPLTDEQKSAMSDREVELWEKNAKEGLLRNDAVLEGVMTDLRSTLYKKPVDSSIALYSLGIKTSSSLEAALSGTLVLDADAEKQLRSMVASSPDEVRNLFSSSGGLGEQMVKAIDRSVGTYVNPGSLARVAGLAGYPDVNSTIYKQVKDINSNLADLMDRYDSEYNRYWKQFNNMEQMIQNMNQQSSWLTQQFSA